MNIKNIIIGLSLTSGLLLSPALAQSIDSIQDTYSSTITLIDGAEEVTLESTSKKNVIEFLESHEINSENYRNEDFSKIDPDDITENLENHKIFRVTSEVKTEEIKLPIPEITKESNELYVGETKVEEEGKEGKANKIITVERILDKQQDSEKLNIVQAPEPKIILKGTKERPAPPPPPVAPALPQITTQPNTNNNQTRVQQPVTTVPYSGYSSYYIYDTSILPAYQNTIMNDLKSMVGKPYVWGQASPNIGFDCSGLIYWAFKKNGIIVPRSSGTLGAYGVPVSLSNLQVGDILGQPGHVAVYAGNGLVIHAFNPEKGVVITPLNMLVKSKQTWARRIL